MGRSGNMSSASSGYTHKMSDEEKARKLAAMKGAADVHSAKVALTAERSKRDQAAEDAEQKLNTGKAKFIDDVGVGAFGVNHNIDMEEANRRKAFTRQKGNKDEAASWQRK